MRKKTIALSVGLMGLLVTGCSNFEIKQEIDTSARDSGSVITQQARQIIRTEDIKRSAENSPVKISNEIYLAQVNTGVDPRYRLPPVFSKEVQMRFDGKVSVSVIANQITRMTGVPVSLAPDVFMPLSSFIKGTSSNMGTQSRQQRNGNTTVSGGGRQAANEPVSLQALNAGNARIPPPIPGGALGSLPPLPGMANFDEQAEKYVSEMELNYTGTLVGLLDLVTTRFALNWEHKDGKINIYRLVTRTIPVFANPGSTTFESAIEKAGGTSGNFSSSSNVSMEANFSVWESLEETISTMLSQAGKYSISQSTGAVTVTDAKNIVDQVEDYIRKENTMMSKQIALRVEIVSVTSNNNQEAGIDWNLVYSKLNDLVPQWTVGISSPSSLATAISGTTGVQILAPITNDRSTTQRMTGSSAMIKALDQVGKTRMVTTSSVVTLNRQPVPLAITNQTSYLAKTTPATGGSLSGAGMPGLEAGEVTTGFMLNLLPSVTIDNQMFLQFSVDISTLDRLNSVGTGAGETAQQIQTPETSSTQFLQRVALKPGSTLVLSGFERELGQYDKRDLTKGMPDLLGSFAGKRNKESLVIMITPVIMGG